MRQRVTTIRRLGGAAAVAMAMVLPATGAQATTAAGPAPFRAVCPPTGPGVARCFTVVAAQQSVRRHAGALPPGYGPPDLQSAYRLPVSRGAGQTIAIVDATDDPTAESDLGVYRSTYGLPPCTTHNGCFRKLNQAGHAGPYPPPDPGWGVEISLDLDMVSAACPLCHIVLVEGNTPLVADLGTSENTAARLGVAAISNSYGLQEFNGMQAFSRDYSHPGTTVVASSGDFGFGPANFPAVLTTVLAVGGTTLTSAGARSWSEIAWYGAGSGCSAYIAKPAWQHDRHCFMRTVADVSADADPSPGLAIYDTSIPPGLGLPPGWSTVGGTSASSPFIAGVIGLAGNGSSITPAFPYQHRHGFHDVVGGSNGYCGGDYLCDGVPGYDGPSGVGSPRGASGL